MPVFFSDDLFAVGGVFFVFARIMISNFAQYSERIVLACHSVCCVCVSRFSMQFVARVHSVKIEECAYQAC